MELVHKDENVNVSVPTPVQDRVNKQGHVLVFDMVGGLGGYILVAVLNHVVEVLKLDTVSVTILRLHSVGTRALVLAISSFHVTLMLVNFQKFKVCIRITNMIL